MKSLDWKYQNEWRLISCDSMLSDENYNCKFFKIQKVFLENKMDHRSRLKIIEICKQKQIPYAEVTISFDKYEMSECKQLCEDCPRLSNEQGQREFS